MENVSVESYQKAATTIKYGGAVEAENCVFISHNAHGVQLETASLFRGKRCLIWKSDNSGVECMTGTVELEDCVIAGNGHNGVTSLNHDQEQHLGGYETKLTMKRCLVFDNGLYGLELGNNVVVGEISEMDRNQFWRNGVGIVAPHEMGFLGSAWDNHEEDFRVLGEKL